MNIIIDLVMFLLLACIPAAFNYFLDYCLGHPMSEDKISPKAIFFSYSLMLAKMNLSTEEQKRIVAGLAPLLNSDDPGTRADGQHQLKVALMISGRKKFFYEQAFGMCPFCTNFWVAFICANVFMFHVPTMFFHGIFYLLIIPIFSHSILRKL